MKQKLKEGILKSGGRIVGEKDYYLKATSPKIKEDKAALIFLDIIERVKQKAVLSGGYELTIYFTKLEDKKDYMKIR